MATFRTVRAMKVSSPLGSGRALTPATTKYAPARIPSDTLLGVRREVIILHAGREYRLRVTQHGRLILTA